MDDDDGESPFHAGEWYMQRRAGVREEAEELGQGMIQPDMPEPYRAFFAAQPIIYVAAEDAATGDVWAGAVVNRRGRLARSRDARHLVLAPAPTSLAADDPVAKALARPGTRVGLLAIELHTRRRIRANGIATPTGTTAAAAAAAVTVAIDQCFGNCPKYIQARRIEVDEARLSGSRAAPTAAAEMGGATLPVAARALIAAADTFFLATSVGANAASQAGTGPRQTAARGADMSHRGGSAGFVTTVADDADGGGPTVLRWSDYVGNGMFNSLGNIVAHPAAGLLFVVWETGTTLQLTGHATVAFSEPAHPNPAQPGHGGDRTVVFRVAAYRLAPRALPILAAPLLQPSPYNPPLATSASAVVGEWADCVAVRAEAAPDVKTFVFAAPPSMRRAGFRPGQYATFDIDVPAAGQRFNRTWTISSHPAQAVASAAGTFSITVKRAGTVTSWMHHALVPGGRILFRGADGEFVVDRRTARRPVLYIAGGIGITPFRPMLAELAAAGVPATLLYSVRTPADAVFLDAFEASYPADQLTVAVTVTGQPSAGAGAAPGWRHGRVTAALIREIAPAYAAMDIYVCGPEPFMAAVLRALGRDLAHPHPDRIFTESFTY